MVGPVRIGHGYSARRRSHRSATPARGRTCSCDIAPPFDSHSERAQALSQRSCLVRAGENRTHSTRTRIVRTTGILRPAHPSSGTGAPFRIRSQIFPRRCSQISRPRLAVSRARETTLRPSNPAAQYSSTVLRQHRQQAALCAFQDSNLRPFECESNALTN